MDLLILGESFGHSCYRGTDRGTPQYQEALPEVHPVNQAFLWYVNNPANDGGGIVQDLGQARALIREYGRLTPPQKFELVEMIYDDHKPELAGEFLGFDVTELYCHSILEAGLQFNLERHQRAMEASDAFRSIAPLVRLFKEYFSNRLNEHVLLPDKETADYCLNCAATLMKFDAELFDMPPESLRVIGLHSVAPESE
ncbi:hypothetical protein RAS2_04150 [Phycisphaerae bacterium RAS2]|nr:hypothetical protein RAS2_04150 [Phycisphaerae bacterium RAS2]